MGSALSDVVGLQMLSGDSCSFAIGTVLDV